MKKFWTKKRIIIAVICVVLIAGITTAAVLITRKNEESKTAEASVSKGSLSSNVSSSGVISTVGASAKIPLYACVNGIDDLETIDDYDGSFDWSTVFLNSTTTPIVYEVTKVNADLKGKSTVLHTSGESTEIFEVQPLILDWDAIEAERAEEIAAGNPNVTAETTLSDFLMMVLFSNGTDSPYDVPNEFLATSGEKISVTTDYLLSIVENATQLEEIDDIEYTLSNFTLSVGKHITLEHNVFKIEVTQLYTVFTVTEYDVANIDARLRKGTRVYAAVSINALDGRKVVAEILEIVKGATSSGVSYFAVQAKIVFGVEKIIDVTADEYKNLAAVKSAVKKKPDLRTITIGDYSYYDPELTPTAVEALDVDLVKAVSREEVLVNYSVSVNVQKTVVYDKLIVPTKCIFYDDNKKPYVTVTADGKERRVYIKILLSTGSEAAVEPLEDYKLADGDKVIYVADSSLISSILG